MSSDRMANPFNVGSDPFPVHHSRKRRSMDFALAMQQADLALPGFRSAHPGYTKLSRNPGSGHCITPKRPVSESVM
jgi:hypothetical protein